MVTEAYWWCGECSHAERVTLEIACHLVRGRTLDSVHQLGVQAFAAAGGDAVNDLPMTCVRVLLAVEMALVDHEVKRVLAPAVGSRTLTRTKNSNSSGLWHATGNSASRSYWRGNWTLSFAGSNEDTGVDRLRDPRRLSRWVQSALKTELLNEVMERCYPSP